jgi:hypothetical protein
VESTVLQRLENLQGTTVSGAAPYAGFETTHACKWNRHFTLSASNSIVKIMVQNGYQ